MGKQNSDTAQLIATTANRLRVIQGDLADKSAEMRSGYLTEELERVLASVSPPERAGGRVGSRARRCRIARLE